MPATTRTFNDAGYTIETPLQVRDPNTRFGLTSGLGDMNMPPLVSEVDPSATAFSAREGK